MWKNNGNICHLKNEHGEEKQHTVYKQSPRQGFGMTEGASCHTSAFLVKDFALGVTCQVQQNVISFTFP